MGNPVVSSRLTFAWTRPAAGLDGPDGLDEPASQVRLPPGDQLVDLLVHGQDIARAVDMPLSVPVESAVAAIDHVLASRWYGAKQRLADLGLDATDADWSGPGGKAVRGPIVSLLLAASGRPAALADLQGPGIEILRGRLA